MTPEAFWRDLYERRAEQSLLHWNQSPETVAKTFGGAQPVYLATPYSKVCVAQNGRWDEFASLCRRRAAAVESARLLAVGVSALSPVVLSVSMIHATGYEDDDLPGASRFVPGIDPLDATLWQRWCQPFLNLCGAIVVPDLRRWSQSEGIKAEVEFALSRNMPVYVYAGAL